MNIEYVIINNHLGVGNKGFFPTILYVYLLN